MVFQLAAASGMVQALAPQRPQAGQLYQYVVTLRTMRGDLPQAQSRMGLIMRDRTLACGAL